MPLPCRILAGFLIITLSLPPFALANPQGGQVRQGQVRIQNLDGQLRVHQESQRAVIDWESFSIDRSEVTRFLQPNANAAALNRVRGAAASRIEGMLRANGKVYLINPNGILIGPNGTIDVGGFVGSTLDTDDGDFMRGGDLRFAGNSDAAIVNLGSISALDGDVVLMAGSVLNEGRISAPRGTAALAAGNDILLTESGEERVFVRGSGGSKKAEGVTNTGEIEANIAELKAHGGNIYGMAVKNEGRVAATGVTRSGGQIFLSAGGGKVRSTGSLKARKSDGSGGRVKVNSGTTGKTEIGGTIDASGDAGAGGEIAILGNEIEVFDGALILNDGETMGGTTYIGGGRRGEDPAFANAEFLTVGSGSLISANALGSGDGGEIVLFANDTATINGTVSARGGAIGGNGGFVELSGRNQLFVPDLVDQVRLSAPFGNSGSLLLDPANINVIHGTGGGILGTIMTDGALMDVLANFPVLIWTSDYGSVGDGDITFAANVNLSWSTPHSLTFQADRDMIFLGGAQVFATGSGAFHASAARSISVGSGASIRTTNGNLNLSANAAGTTTGNFVGVDVNGGLVQSTGTGSVSVTGRGGNDAGGNQIGVRVRSDGDILGGTTGLVSVTGYGGSSTGSGNIGVNVFGSALTTIGSAGANVQVTGTGGAGNASMGIELGTGNSNGRITSGGLGSVTVQGTGGTQSGGAFLHGIIMGTATIDSAGGNVSVTGIGGSGSNPSGDYTGIQMDDSTISAGGGGAVTVTGTAGTAASSQTLIGVDVRFTSQITSAGGNVTVTGTGGNTTNALLGAGSGIRLIGNGTITAGGTGTVNVIGSGVGGSTVGHEGIVINGSGLNSNLARIGAANGTTAITATSGNGASHALVVGTGTAGRITTGNHNLILINTDSLSVGSAGTLSSGTGNMMINTRSTGTLINLGGVDVLSGSPLTLGLTDAELDRITAGSLQIGSSNSGSITVSSAITHDNSLSLSTGGGLTVNNAITMALNKNFTASVADTINLATSSADLSTSGTGTVSLTTLRNISLAGNSSIITTVGNLTLSANAAGTTSGLFEGVYVGNGASINSGTGTISITGRGGDTINAGNHGIRLDSTSTVGSAGGNIFLTGQARGSSGANPTQEGLIVRGDITTTGNGNITLSGTGGNATSGNIGVNLFDDVLVSTVNGDISITGISGTGTNSPGIQVADFGGTPTVITSTGGSITFIGDGSAGSSAGIIAFGSGTSIGGGTGNVGFTATGDFSLSSNAAIGASGNGAVSLASTRSISLGAGTSVTTVNGNLTVSANQQVSPTAGNFAGIHVNGGTVSSLGSGAVLLTGLGGDSGGNNYGVHLNGGAQVLGGTTNELVITGYGGAGSGPINVGIAVSDFGTLVSSLGGNVILSGSGGNAVTSDSSSGVFVTGSSTITSGTGASVTIVGVGGSGENNNNRGVFIVSPLANNPTTVSTGGGDLQIIGTGGGTATSFGDHGVDIAYGNSFPNVGSNGGTVTITGYVGLNLLNYGVRIDGNVTTTGNRNIQIHTNRLNLTGGASINSGSGTTQLLPASNGFEINLGGADSSTSLGINDGELDRINAGTILVGSTTSSLLTVSAPITAANHLFLQSGSGAVVQNSIAMAANRNLRIETLGTNLGTLSLATADADLSASGTGAITLMSTRNIVLTPGSSVAAVNGNIHLTANQNSLPTSGSFSGIDVAGANLSSTGTGSLSLWGRGGDDTISQHGILIRGGSSLVTNGQNLTLSGVSPDPASSGLFFELATLGAGGGTIDLNGDGGDASISATDSAAVIGGTGDTLLLNSLSGDVEVLARLVGSRLQLRDLGNMENISFSLTNTNNDLDRVNSYGNGTNGRVASVDFRDVDGFEVTDFLGSSGISAVGGVSLVGALYGNESILVNRPVTSVSGDIMIKGRDVVVDGTEISTGGNGLLTMQAGRAILVQGDSLLSVTNGKMDLSANRDEVSIAGNFTGITILGSRVQSLGLGAITLAGTGGDGTMGSDFAYPGFTNPSSNGIRLDGGTVITSSDTTSDSIGIELFGTGGGAASESVGVVIANTDTIVSTARRSIQIEGYGGGQAMGQRNRGVLFTGGLIQAGSSAYVTLFGDGGAGINENDGIQLDAGARVQAVNGGITLDGYAGDTLGIGVMLGNTSGGLTITGSGSVEVMGTGSNADGIVLGNSASSVGGAAASFVDLLGRGSNLTLQRNLVASGNVFLKADGGDVLIKDEVTSHNGNIEIDGDNITIDAPVTSSSGDITLIFGDHPEVFDGEPEVLEIGSPPFNGTAAINDVLSADGAISYIGGDGTGDLLTFAGFTASEITLQHDDLVSVESVVGTGSANDRVAGPLLASTYQFTGSDAFNVGGVAYSAFENVDGGAGNDTFSFSGSATLSGHLDGGGGSNTLDYCSYATGVIIDLPAGAATGIVGGFENISSFSGSGNIDTITGPGSASTYVFTGPDAMQVGSVSVSGFENLIAGPLEDNFVFLPGSSLRGYIDGGSSPTPVVNHLNYSLYGAPVAVNLGGIPFAGATAIGGGFTNLNQFTGSALQTDQFFGSNLATSYQITAPNVFSSSLFTATGFENLTGGLSSDTFVPGPGAALSGRLSGGVGGGTDTLDYSLFGRAVTVNVGPNTATGFGGGFADLERIIGSPGNDRFNFLDQETIQFVDGGGGTDLLEINDSDLGGDNTYEITASSVSRNPLYTFNNFEALRLYLGRGNNTVNSGFFPYTQFIHGGSGFNTLNLPGVSSLNQGNPIRNVYHYGIDAPRPGGTDNGGLLQLEINQRNSANPNTQQGFNTENRFSIVDPATLSQQIGALSGAFAAAVTAQAALIVVDGNPYLVFRPFSLDGSGIAPSNLAAGALNESLGVDANLELAAAIGYTGPIFLFNPDGAHGLDLSGAPVDPVILTLLQESLAIAAAAELSAALGLNLVVSTTATDGIVPISLDNAVPGQPIVLLLSEQLGDPAFNELNAALGAN